MHVAGGCAAERCEVAREDDEEAIAAIGGAPNGRFLHCLDDRTGIKCPCPLPSELGRGTVVHCCTNLQFYLSTPSSYAATCGSPP